MRFSNVRLLVKDFAKCFKFYTEQLGLEPSWGDENSGYANFKVADGIEGFTLFVSDWMAPAVGNADKQQPVAMREKLMVSFSVDNLDETFADLKSKRRDVYHRTYGYARLGDAYPIPARSRRKPDRTLYPSSTGAM